VPLGVMYSAEVEWEADTLDAERCRGVGLGPLRDLVK
jgi:hypothetical protein